VDNDKWDPNFETNGKVDQDQTEDALSKGIALSSF
jgi:hypothetical protein